MWLSNAQPQIEFVLKLCKLAFHAELPITCRTDENPCQSPGSLLIKKH
jgi:hypothetical protein